MGKIKGFDGKEYKHSYTAQNGGWLDTDSAICGVISITGDRVVTRVKSPTTGDEALLYLASPYIEDFGVVSVTKDGEYMRIPLVDFINGDYKLPEKGEL